MKDELGKIVEFEEGLKTLEFNLKVKKYDKIHDKNLLYCTGELVTLNDKKNINFSAIVDPYLTSSNIQSLEFDFHFQNSLKQKTNFSLNLDHTFMNTDINLDDTSIDQIINICSKNQFNSNLKLKLRLQFLETLNLFVDEETNYLSEGDRIFVKTGVVDYDHKNWVEYDADNYGNGDYNFEIMKDDNIVLFVSN